MLWMPFSANEYNTKGGIGQRKLRLVSGKMASEKKDSCNCGGAGAIAFIVGKTFYGLKQAGRQWRTKLNTKFKDRGTNQIKHKTYRY